MANVQCLFKLFTIITLTLTFDLKAQADDATQPVIIDNTLYLIWHEDKLNWWESRAFCRDKNMKLVSFSNAEKLQKLSTYLKDQGFVDKPEIGNEYIYWTSGNDLKGEGVFVWDYGGPKFSYTNWLDTQPDNWRGDEHCVEMGFMELGKWNDNRCRYHRHFICEREVDIDVGAV